MENSVRERRIEKGWTQDELGERLDVSRQTINSIERGRYNPSLILAYKLSQLFGCTIEQLFDFEKELEK
ncbi:MULTISPECIES: helix-turn-helix transcriptional regulator [Savagea]|uniref:Helix-turn-helix transcriptional regulator n=2 Tax=Savagea TaxID=1655429 RepID=A0A8J7G6L8_9BACL|nr:helix-turn-helix transcriptional regulator [Savagea serpentis]MBF4501256.1 helix-turn-helix transcriptional regulator [Savagea serpentis]